MSEGKNRDEQFNGFAKALTDELIKYLTSRSGLTLDEIEQEWHKVVARRAYDLACHVVTHCDEDIAWRKGKGYSTGQIVENDVPDLPELPKEQE